LSASEQDSRASPELWVKKAVDGPLQKLNVCESEVAQSGDRQTWTTQWICDSSVGEAGLHVSLHMGQAADTLSALEGRRHETAPSCVLDLFIDKFATPTETLQHREHRSRADSNEEYSAHPLFSRWVAEDSPAFRSAISGMEELALANRTHYKDLSRQSTGLRDAYQSFMKQLNESLALLESMPVLNPLVSTVIQPLKNDISQMLNTLCGNWDSVVVSSARRLYESSYKLLEERKSEFDNASDQYYSELSKYLKAKASKEDDRRDEAFNRHRVAFDSARCAYFIDL
ncbi:hypothetical protein IWW47_006064, partial [Coemansia sp. RSA 2052]